MKTQGKSLFDNDEIQKIFNNKDIKEEQYKENYKMLLKKNKRRYEQMEIIPCSWGEGEKHSCNA